MTEHCFENPNSTPTKINTKSSDLAAIFSVIFSHPLYFSYLIFFSPYLLKLLSFLSPLFITTSLLFLSLLTAIVPHNSILKSKEGFLLTAYNILLEKLHPEFDIEHVEEFEVYKIVFETPTIEAIEENPDEIGRVEEDPVGFSEEKETEIGCESLSMRPESVDPSPDKVKEQVKKFESMFTRSGSEASKISAISVNLKPRCGSLRVDNEKKLSEAFSQTVGSPPYLGSFGSMRKEREWRRTLACKLFEERHSSNIARVNVCGNEERMDLLWEAYETEPNKIKAKGRRKEKAQELTAVMSDDDGYDHDDDPDENGRLCCLQALKLSAGKMNLNMGRPNLLKIGKAFKGFGWLNSHIRKQGKNGYK